MEKNQPKKTPNQNQTNSYLNEIMFQVWSK